MPDIIRLCQNSSNWKRFCIYGNSGKSLKEKSAKCCCSACVFLSSAYFRQHRHLQWICASKKTIRGVTSDTGECESDCTRASARLLRYITLRYITVSGRRVHADRVATVLRDLEERPPVQWWHVARPAYHRHDEIKRCVQRHTPLTIAKAARRVAL